MPSDNDRPQRWDQSFASELNLEMGDQDVESVICTHLPELKHDEDSFPRNVPLRDIIKNDTRIREYKDGEFIVRKGEYGNSAFVILSGEVRILEKDLPAEVMGKKDEQKHGFFDLLARIIRPAHKFPEYRSPRSLGGEQREDFDIVQLEDYPEYLQEKEGVMVKLKHSKRPEQYREKPYPGHIFGEIAALGRTPRTLTIVAHSTPENPTRLLEIRWQGLREIRRYSKGWKEMIDRRYRLFSLITHLRTALYTRNVWDFDFAVSKQLETFLQKSPFQFREMNPQKRRKLPEGKEPLDITTEEVKRILSGINYAIKFKADFSVSDPVAAVEQIFDDLLNKRSNAAKKFLEIYSHDFKTDLKRHDLDLIGQLQEFKSKVEKTGSVFETLWSSAEAGAAAKNIVDPDRIAPDFDALLRETVFNSHGSFDWYGSFKKLTELSPQERLKHEPVIEEEGNYPDGMYLVRSGFARVTRRYHDGERTISYIGKGRVFGFYEVFHNYHFAKGEKSKDMELGLQDSPMMVMDTLRAIGYADTLLIPTATVEKHVIPLLKEEEIGLLRKSISRLRSRKKQLEDPLYLLNQRKNASQAISHELLEFMVQRRAINGTASMLIDLNRCTRCDDCIRACAAAHDGNPRFARQGPSNGNIQLTQSCMHCTDPVCMIGCPTGAIHRGESGGEVVINASTCIGCSTCANSCPYNNIQMVEIRDEQGEFRTGTSENNMGNPILQATKCDLCYTEVTGPSCQNACPHDALMRVNVSRPEKLVEWLGRRT